MSAKPKNGSPRRDAVEILHRRYFESKPEMLAMLKKRGSKTKSRGKIYCLRTEAGLTQRRGWRKLVGRPPRDLPSGRRRL